MAPKGWTLENETDRAFSFGRAAVKVLFIERCKGYMQQGYT